MVSVYDLKPAFQKLLRPVVDWSAKHHVSANQVTIAACILSLLTGVVIALFPDKPHVLLTIPVVLFLRMALNAIDGMLAREHHMQTSLGIFLNELGDVFSDIFLTLPLSLVPGFSKVLITGIVIFAIIVEMTGVIAIQAGVKRRYDGPMGKSDRAFIFGLMCLLIGAGVPQGIWINAVLIIVLLLLAYTMVNRVNKSLKESIRHES